MFCLNLKKVVLYPATVYVLLFAAALSHAAKNFEQTATGIIVHTATGVTRIEVCSSQVIHIIGSATDLQANPLVPAVIRPCTGASFKISSDGAGVHLVTDSVKVDVRADTGAVRFSSLNGETVLSEQPSGGRILGIWDGEQPLSGIEQTFLLASNEALYGLGQHQEGLLDIRGVPIRLLQANTNIAIPFLISTKGMACCGTILPSRISTLRHRRCSLIRMAQGHFAPVPRAIMGFW